jgi:hypothetical protein
MAEGPVTDPARRDAAGRPAPDSELRLQAVVATGVALAVVTALAAAVTWWLAVALRDRLENRDPAPPALVEAQMPYRPPSPNLQLAPENELAAARAEEEALLGAYAWTDAAQSAARVPIERAMELLLERRPGAEALAGPTPEGAAPVAADDEGVGDGR